VSPWTAFIAVFVLVSLLAMAHTMHRSDWEKHPEDWP